jgi:Activator of Hsp90 ATPase homolog 1-like protein
VSGFSGLRMARVIPAPRERVFRAWTDPDELKRWWGPGQFTTPHADPYRLGWESGLDKLAAVLDHTDGSLTREGGNGA